MEIIAISRSVRVAPRKIRLVADLIRKKSIDQALISLELLQKRGGVAIYKTLKSAMANALNRGQKQDNLIIKSLDVFEGQSFKRFHPSSRGRAHPYKRRGSNIKIVLTEKGAKQNGTKS